MSRSFFLAAMLYLLCASASVHAMQLDEYFEEAKEYQESRQTDRAIETMKRAVAEHPESSKAYNYLGDLIGERVRRTESFGEMILGVEEAFAMWNKAVELDERNYEARFTRGAWGVSIPKFAGRLKGGVKDLEYMTQVLQFAPGEEARQHLISAYIYLGDGYLKLGKLEKAKETFGKVIKLAPETEHAEAAQRNLDRIKLAREWQKEQEELRGPEGSEIALLKKQEEKDPSNVKLLTELGNAYLADERYDEAEALFRRVIEQDSSDAAAYTSLALALTGRVAHGYDPRIALDTDLRTDLAFEVMLVLDKAVEIDPANIELRLLRGASAAQMPFFVGRRDQGMDDLRMVIESAADEAVKAEAEYHLGFAYQKKAVSHWNRVVLDYASPDATQQVFDALRPQIDRLDSSQHKRPYVVIDFILGFKDELAPQTAVWVEDEEGAFLKTIFVSGFSGHAQDRQINLPKWANVSGFADVDGVTGASIDLGRHVYVWDLRDIAGQTVAKGDYIVKVEAMYWPSMQYQRVEAPIRIGEDGGHAAVEEGNLVPYLEVNYVGE
jgi:tetratricopeptide (TPR) repeat protein